MISFMVLSLPRSASTWAANWLCTDRTHCLHDPLWQYHWSELDTIPSNKLLGIACTGLYLFPAFISKHPAKKVILHRPIEEINASLQAIGLLPLPEDSENLLDSIVGLHVQHTELFTAPAKIWKYLFGTTFDAERHTELCNISMQPNFDQLAVNKEVTRKLLTELRGI